MSGGFNFHKIQNSVEKSFGHESGVAQAVEKVVNGLHNIGRVLSQSAQQRAVQANKSDFFGKKVTPSQASENTTTTTSSRNPAIDLAKGSEAQAVVQEAAKTVGDCERRLSHGAPRHTTTAETPEPNPAAEQVVTPRAKV